MASQCTALSNAIKSKGLSYAQLAQRAGMDERRVVDIVSGRARPTQQEFNKLATALGIAASGIPAHGTK